MRQGRRIRLQHPPPTLGVPNQTQSETRSSTPSAPLFAIGDALLARAFGEGSPSESDGKQHLMTVGLEDYFQVGAFNRLIQHRQWYRFETRVERGTRSALDLLDEHGVKATFFVLGWVAEQVPELIAEVAARGHEVASKGYYHRSIRQLAPQEFREDLVRAREVIQRASGKRVLGYRVADGWFDPSDLWALDVLAEEGYAYDSSIAPLFRRWSAEPWRRFAHTHRNGDRALWEFPISTSSVLGAQVPIAGGNWFRQIPHTLLKHAVARWMRTYTSPFVMYFHTWELDPDQPKIDAAPLVQRIRQYRGLQKMSWVLRHYLERHRFTSAADYLQLATALPEGARAATPAPARRPSPVAVRLAASAADPVRTPVSVVIPCYNEELILPYLANTLASMEESLPQYDLRFVFVDDCSTDGTLKALRRIFGGKPNCTVVHHERNGGVAAAILTGLRASRTEIVCSIDCDCTYDPHELGRMIPMLGDDVDLVTASPYHPQGGVRNVPEWRLSLSRGLSSLYRRVLRNQLHTYTSCFRVYRRSAALGVTLTRSGFLGVMEFLARLDLAGSRIVEFPTVLEVRMIGRSKMKVARTILGHLRLLASMMRLRMNGGGTLERVPLEAEPAVRSAVAVPAGARLGTLNPAPRVEHHV